jgi:sulfoxide reductase heme-binding subunit YedZ
MTDATAHLFWITSRAAGVTALVLASVAVAAGLAIGARRGPLGGRAAQLRTLHEALSLATLAALALHGLSLLGDGWLHPGLAGIAVPFAGSYRPLWTGLGIIGGYGLAALSLSYYARARIGVARWRTLHRFVAVFWLLGVVHTLGAGTDAGQPWFLLLATIVVLPPLVALAMRWRLRLELAPAEGPTARSPAA